MICPVFQKSSSVLAPGILGRATKTVRGHKNWAAAAQENLQMVFLLISLPLRADFFQKLPQSDMVLPFRTEFFTK